jgi:hypothetical protein
MAKSLKVRKTEDGEIGVVCTRCYVAVVPVHSDLLDYWDCPDCNLQLDPSSLRAYKKALRDADEKEEMDTFE